MDYDTLLRDTWDRIMERIAMDQLDDSIGSSLPDISNSFDSDIQFEMELDNMHDQIIQPSVHESGNAIELDATEMDNGMPEANIKDENNNDGAKNVSDKDMESKSDETDHVSDPDNDSKVKK